MTVRLSWLRWFIPVLMFGIGISTTVFVSQVVSRDARESWENEADRVSQWLSGAALGWMEESYALLSGLATLFENSSNVTEEEFLNAFDGLEARSSASFLDAVAAAVPSDPSNVGERWVVQYSSDLLGVLKVGSKLYKNGDLLAALDAATARFGRTVMGYPYVDEFGEMISPVVIVLETPKGPVAVIGLLNHNSVINGLELVHAPEGTSIGLMGRFPDVWDRRDPFLVSGQAPGDLLYSTTSRTISAEADITFTWWFTNRFGGGPDQTFATTVLWFGISLSVLVTFVITVLMARNREISRRVQVATADLERQGQLITAVLKSVRQGLAAYDKDLKLVVANDRFKKIREVPDHLAVPGASFEDWMHFDAERGEFGDGDPTALAELRIAKAKRFKQHQLVRTRPNGMILEIEGGPIPGGGFVSTFSDITERKTAEDALEKAYHTISDSIEYASHLQRAILPVDSRIECRFSQFFRIWQPRDVVGGDMYWVREWHGGTLVLLGDCTGHGVPGAFMTLIASAALDHAMHEVPTDELDSLMQEMHRYIQTALGQESGESDSDDGMDVGICFIRPGAAHLSFCGARFPLFVFDGTDVVEWKGTRKGIGYPGVLRDVNFPVHTVPLSPNHCYFMTTDGALDQIGGERRQGFGKRRFKRTLAEIGSEDCATQKTHLWNTLKAYQGEEVSRDDMAIIGFRVGTKE